MAKIIKVCGLKTADAAYTAIENGANLLGVILVPNRARTVDPQQAIEISKLCRAKRISNGSRFVDSRDLLNYMRNIDEVGPEWFEISVNQVTENGPFLVGVFRNQPLEDVIKASKELNLDFVQLHGSENVDDYSSQLDIPVISRFVLNKPGIENALMTHKFIIPLLDSEVGGEGKLIDWDDASSFGDKMKGRYILAGGLTPENVDQALNVSGCCGVDVSGGVETEGVKDLGKVKAFVVNAKNTCK
ncbi:uncharacterized protein C5L36_0B08250 [Pichia kudriavzevii]|nr:uncharacterized protein C5L36_0B08250 [Pichia kudriavzevii]ABU53939.1 phosphoribosyl anthranilate isomerase [Pichia kudriavzevii]AWU75579.1 hypothetical protein C5L36_0B08250 [Pichia kudriavzevii]